MQCALFQASASDRAGSCRRERPGAAGIGNCIGSGNLIGAFETPPSFLDEFKLRYGHHFSFPVGELTNALAAERQRANQAEVELIALKQSRSWRAVQVFRAMLGRR
ncbi:hypothetical protein M2318_003015 [Metapseudomonas resinovorans]|uniref:hypothetical protein n=1 Tax=Metapseudomonas resinovorans TaxID=53412 RepID=UPI003D1FB188